MGLSLGAVLEAEGRSSAKGVVTSSLAADYLGPAELGQWLDVDTAFIHAGGSQGVAQAFVTADRAIIARTNATVRFG